jgi:hypothetical protein
MSSPYLGIGHWKSLHFTLADKNILWSSGLRNVMINRRSWMIESRVAPRGDVARCVQAFFRVKFKLRRNRKIEVWARDLLLGQFGLDARVMSGCAVISCLTRSSCAAKAYGLYPPNLAELTLPVSRSSRRKRPTELRLTPNRSAASSRVAP